MFLDRMKFKDYPRLGCLIGYVSEALANTRLP